MKLSDIIGYLPVFEQVILYQSLNYQTTHSLDYNPQNTTLNSDFFLGLIYKFNY